MAKSIFKSKTFWVNFLTILTGVMAAFTSVIPHEVQGYILASVGAINVILRFLTKTAVKL